MIRFLRHITIFLLFIFVFGLTNGWGQATEQHVCVGQTVDYHMYGFDASTVEWKVNTSPVTMPVSVVTHSIDATDAVNHPVHPDADKSNYFKDIFSYTWTSAGTFTVEIVETTPGCSSDVITLTVYVHALPPGTLTSSDSDNTICAGDNVTFTANGGTNYNFKVDGSSVQNGDGSTYSTTGLTNGQEVTVEVTNANGCIATYAGITTTVLTSPSDAGDITGDAIVQSGQTGVIYRIPAVTNATNYDWEYSGTGANITNNGDEITVNFAADATSGELKVRGTNACGIGGYSELFSIYVVSPCETTIENWTFNEPVLTQDWKVYSTVNGWSSTPHGIEIWRSGFLGVSTPDGGQFCELNSKGANTMYQDLDVNPGAEMVWAITYRYRNSSSETIRLRIGPVGGTLSNIATITNDIGDAWVVHSGSYTVPSSLPGGKVRFQIETVSPSSSSGNLIDGIQFYSVNSDVEPPQFIKSTLPANTIDLGSACDFTLPDYTVGVDAIDNCDADLVITQNPAAGTKVFGGEKVILTATDEAGNEATYEMNVLGDNVSPTASNPSPITVKCISKVPTPDITVVTDEADNCTVTPTVAWVSDSNNGGLGTTASPYIVTRIYSVTDDASNSINVSQTITAIDDVNPAITAPADVNVNSDAGSCDASSVALGTPTTSDNCGVASVTNNAPVTFPLGNTTVTWTVTDNAGLTSTDTQVVTVTDNQDPTISCSGNIAQPADAGSCGAVVTYTTPVGVDNCAGATTVQTAGLASGAIFPVGTTTNTFEVTDAAGNEATCSFDVTVIKENNISLVDVTGTTNPETDAGFTNGTHCPDLNGLQAVIEPSGNTYSPGTSQIQFRVNRLCDTGAWSFNYSIGGTGVTVHEVLISGFGTTTNASGVVNADAGTDYILFTIDINNVVGTILPIDFTISDGGTDSAIKDAITIQHNLKIIPQIVGFE
ncbi:HYR domain-containing protein [Marinifilum sp. D737]|uniref:HYR domain-containing protein n=1 Tax=Marinifilum sp. D737 TaxID=2969628 RepID=UPI0022758869|nr:HYR domain-containing protein [Marinifilum sp. D737]MCY1635871.1 HYR domain-containing protein [Marinifilum sp. D737]